MAVTQRQRNVVNPAGSSRRRLSPAQIKAGFGGKRRQAAAKTKRRKPKAQTKVNRPKSHRPRTAPAPKRKSRRSSPRATKKNLGKVISLRIPGESMATATKKNKSRKNARRYSTDRRATKKNTGHRRRGSLRNPGMGDITGLLTNAVFTVAGAVGSQQITQMVLQTNNTGIMGYLGNLITGLVLSWGVKAFMHNEKAAAAVLAGSMVQVVLRLVADYTPFGQYTSSLGMGDYLSQVYLVPQHIARSRNWPHSATLTQSPTMGNNGMNGFGCGNDMYGANSMYSAA